MGHNRWTLLAADILSLVVPYNHRPEASLLVANTQLMVASCGSFLAAAGGGGGCGCGVFGDLLGVCAVLWCSLVVREVIIFNLFISSFFGNILIF